MSDVTLAVLPPPKRLLFLPSRVWCHRRWKPALHYVINTVRKDAVVTWRFRTYLLLNRSKLGVEGLKNKPVIPVFLDRVFELAKRDVADPATTHDESEVSTAEDWQLCLLLLVLRGRQTFSRWWSWRGSCLGRWNTICVCLRYPKSFCL